MRISLAWKFTLVFLAVFAITLALVLFSLERATTGSFNSYLTHAQAMRDMMGGGARAMMGPSEQGFLHHLRRSVLLAGIIGAAAAGLAGWLLARYITSPLRDLAQAARRLAGGDLGTRVAEGGNDELADVADAFNRMAAALQSQDEERRRFMADVAHELRTPLSVLQAEIEALQDGVIEPAPERLASLHDEIDLLSRLVQDLRTLSLAESGELALSLSPQDPRDLLERAVAGAAATAAAQDIEVVLEAPAALPAALMDSDRMAQVLHNLLSNALRHAPAGSRVAVTASTQGGTLQIAVRDAGPGIPPEALPHVFDRFYRADAARSRAAGGSGLGLAIARQIVLGHGGQISAGNNDPPPGAVFTVRLPVAAAAAARPVPAASSPSLNPSA